ncbi:MAG: hypothetical protein JNL32_04410 [Candidatus Kapabacteria bacterium]|nr:hypothetical protein [Candidatus Kapabacteria bacterium]
MSKKQINRKEILRLIQEGLEQGKPREQIRDELAAQYYGATSIEKFIASTPDPHIRKEYSVTNTVLVVVMVLLAVQKIFSAVIMVNTMDVHPAVVLLSVPYPLFFIMIAYEVWQFKGWAYNVTALFTLVMLIRSFQSNVFSSSGIELVFTFLPPVTVMVLAVYLGKTLFPHYGVFGPKKDAHGKTILG